MILTAHELEIGYAARSRRRSVAAHLNIELHAGELVCLLGPNGAGKSTLMRTLAGMQPPLSGVVQLEGEDLHRLEPAALAQRVAVVLTERIDAANLTAYELAALGRHPYTDWSGRLSGVDEEKVRAALRAVGAADLAARPVFELSDGERQRVLIARALAQEPRLILLDEPTAFLDLPRRVEMMRLLRDLAHTSGTAILLSTHDLDLALRMADVLWLLASGGTLSVGLPEALVLEGAFARTFPDLEFDTLRGTFRIEDAARGTVGVRGSGLAAVWTVRALERIGFAVRDDATLCVEVEMRSDATVWMFDGVEYHALDLLLAAMRFPI